MSSSNARTISTVRLLTAAVLLASTIGCNAPVDDGAAALDPAPERLGQQEIKPDPNSTYFAEVEANGTGCPRGTWNTRIARDGLVFTTTFSAYVAELNPQTGVAVQDCTLAIRLHTPEGRSFSVQTFSYSGYALLQPGVTGRQLASYSFQGTPVQTEAGRADLIGPYDGDFLFKDEVALEDTVWSPCGLERDLIIRTRILLQNTTSPGRSGYMNLSSTDGSALIVKLAARGCDSFGTPPAATPATSDVTMGQPAILPIDDYDNGNLLLAQAAQLEKRGALKSLSFYVTEAKGLLRLGVYDASGPNGGPGNKLAETAEIRPVVGWNTARVAPVSLAAGKYWLAYLPSDSGLHFRRGGDRSGANTWFAYPYGPLPATFSKTPIVSTDHWSFYGTLTP